MAHQTHPAFKPNLPLLSQRSESEFARIPPTLPSLLSQAACATQVSDNTCLPNPLVWLLIMLWQATALIKGSWNPLRHWNDPTMARVRGALNKESFVNSA